MQNSFLADETNCYNYICYKPILVNLSFFGGKKTNTPMVQ